MPHHFNPLPPDKVGKELLLDLRTESVITSLRLPLEWESKGAPTFVETRAIVARIFFGPKGSTKLSEEEHLWLRDHRVAAKIVEKAQKLNRFASDPSERHKTGVQEALMLGFGHDVDPSKIDRRIVPSIWFAKELCRALNLPERAISPRQVETAKDTVSELYATHLGRQRKRHNYSNSSLSKSPLAAWLKAWGYRTD